VIGQVQNSNIHPYYAIFSSGERKWIVSGWDETVSEPHKATARWGRYDPITGLEATYESIPGFYDNANHEMDEHFLTINSLPGERYAIAKNHYWGSIFS